MEPPSIPVRVRGVQRASQPAQLRPSDAQLVRDHSATPEVMSNLISSLSIISGPANHHFEHKKTDIPESLFSVYSSSRAGKRSNNYQERKGSFGKDYGAFDPPALDDNNTININELAATAPTIRTAKPPSGYSAITAPKSPTKSLDKRSTRRNTSRPSSKASSEDENVIGIVTIEPGVSPRELKRQPSVESWGKKQGRKHKGLMYMSSRERLQEAEAKRASSDAIGNAMSSTTNSFVASSTITEEVMHEHGEPSQVEVDNGGHAAEPIVGPASPELISIGGGMFIPVRESSLRSRPSPMKKHASYRASRQNGEIDSATIKEAHEDGASSPTKSHGRRRRERHHSKALEETFRLQEPLSTPPLEDATTLASRQLSSAARIEEWQIYTPNEDLPRTPQRRASEHLEKGPGGRDFLLSSERTRRPTPDKSSTPGRLSAPVLDRSLSDAAKRASKFSTKSAPTPEPFQPFDDRPASSDSVDDALDAYLCSPRLSQKIRHPQTGRVISFSEVGDPEGYAVFVCVGMGLTRYITAFYDELALTLKLRLITPDRPGVGESEPYSDGTSTPLSWPDDIYAICQALKITKFSILAHSAGAIYALATALRMPQHIRGRIHLLAPWIPPSQLNVFGGKQVMPPANSIPTSQRILRALPTPILRVANSSFMSVTSASVTTSLPRSSKRGNKRKSAASALTLKDGRSSIQPAGYNNENQDPSITDRPSSSHLIALAASDPSDPNHQTALLQAAAQNLAQQERQTAYDTRLTHAIWDLATTNANPAVDLLVCLERRHEIGFRYVDITRSCVIHHGTKDSRVPVENVKWLGKMMRRCEVRILEGEGHGLMASAGVMGGVLMEISKEWEDWMLVVKGQQHVAGAGGARKMSLRERASTGNFI